MSIKLLVRLRSLLPGWRHEVCNTVTERRGAHRRSKHDEAKKPPWKLHIPQQRHQLPCRLRPTTAHECADSHHTQTGDAPHNAYSTGFSMTLPSRYHHNES